jgi:hypothetical protein
MLITFGNITINGSAITDPNDASGHFSVSHGSEITIKGVVWVKQAEKWVKKIMPLAGEKE